MNKMLAYLASGLAATIGTLVLIGWHFDIEGLRSMALNQNPMNPMVAVGFILLALALVAHLKNSGVLFYTASGLVFAIGFLNLINFFGTDLKLDTLLYVRNFEPSNPAALNRMAPNTALNFLLFSLSLLSIRSRIWLSQSINVLTLIISFLAILGYIYGVVPLTQISYFNPMALITALTFALSALGFLAADCDVGLSGLITHKDSGGFFLRRTVPLLVMLPPVFGWLAIQGEKLSYFGSSYGIALMVAAGIIMTTAVMFSSARAANLMSKQVYELNVQLQIKLKELAAEKKESDSFSYAVSHDLRTPLRTIIGFNKMIFETEAPNLSQEGKDYLHRVTQAAHRMARLIDGLLDLAKLGRKELQPKDISISQIATQIAAQLKESAPSRVVEFIIADNLAAHGDERLIENVLQNLISNAFKFTSKIQAGEIEIGSTTTDYTKMYFVKDNGAGFDMKHADKLFGAFQRLHANSEFEGTGIGLATVHRIITRHGGTIWAESKINEGTTFYFTLPNR